MRRRRRRRRRWGFIVVTLLILHQWIPPFLFLVMWWWCYWMGVRLLFCSADAHPELPLASLFFLVEHESRFSQSSKIRWLHLFPFFPPSLSSFFCEEKCTRSCCATNLNQSIHRTRETTRHKQQSTWESNTRFFGRSADRSVQNLMQLESNGRRQVEFEEMREWKREREQIEESATFPLTLLLESLDRVNRMKREEERITSWSISPSPLLSWLTTSCSVNHSVSHHHHHDEHLELLSTRSSSWF